MDLSVTLNAKEVLFHLNYMGYRNITKEQLKYFMTGLFTYISNKNIPANQIYFRFEKAC